MLLLYKLNILVRSQTHFDIGLVQIKPNIDYQTARYRDSIHTYVLQLEITQIPKCYNVSNSFGWQSTKRRVIYFTDIEKESIDAKAYDKLFKMKIYDQRRSTIRLSLIMCIS